MSRVRSRSTCVYAFLVIGLPVVAAGQPIHVGSRLELLADRHVIDSMDGTTHEFHEPVPADTALAFDSPWDGKYSAYITVFQDGEIYRMYYRGYPELGAEQVTCYAESSDGIQWTKPDLGLHMIGGSLENNVILRADVAPGVTHNFCVFLDDRPGVPASQRYKGIGGGSGGLYGLVSPDGINWSLVHASPIITGGAFDSLNVAFWSQAENQYVCYYRTFNNGYRSISRQTSADFLNWSGAVLMEYDTPAEHLYTNATHPYFRAPHIYIGLPARLLPGRRALTDQQAADLGIDPASFLLGDLSEACFMTTRAGSTEYDRPFLDGYPRPGLGYENWVSRTNYPAFGTVPTAEHEISMYVRRDYGQATAHIERMVLRTDGFASIRGPYAGGTMTTHPLVFSGRELAVNYSTSAAGSMWVELQDETGAPIPGFSRGEADEIIGDEIARVVSWGSRTDVSSLIGQPVRLHVELKDADLFSFQFRSEGVGGDICEDATILSGETTVYGTTENATSDGTPSACTGFEGVPDVWYAWTSPGSGTLTVDTCPLAEADTTVGIYAGSCGALQELACNEACGGDPCSGPSSCATINTQRDETYYIRVATADPAGGPFALRLTPHISYPPLPEAIVLWRNSQRIWQDDGFEDDAVGGGPNAPFVGAWTVSGPVTVLGPNDSGPGAFRGENYLRFQRTSSGSPAINLENLELAPGDTFMMDFAINATVSGPNLSLQTSDTASFPSTYIQLFYFWGPTSSGSWPAPGSITYYDGSGHAQTGLTHTPGQWSTVRMVWTVGEAEMELIVDGKAVTIPVWQPGNTPVAFRFATGLADSQAYFDAVAFPVPADFDGDLDVDQTDYGLMQRCYTDAVPMPQIEPGCKPADLNGDGAIDELDLMRFLDCNEGPNVPAVPGCGQ